MEMGPTEKGLSRTYVLQAVERSLQRLQIDCIDLYQAHKDDEAIPLEETLGAFADLIKQGKVLAIGASNYTAERLAQALPREQGEQAAALRVPAAAVQPLSTALPTRRRWSRSAGRRAWASSPTTPSPAGFLTGKYRSEADLAQSQRGEDGQEVPQRSRAAHPRGPRCGRRAVPLDSGPGGPRLAAGPAERDGTDRQRDEPGAVHRPYRGHPPQPGRRDRGGAEPGERM